MTEFEILIALADPRLISLTNRTSRWEILFRNPDGSEAMIVDKHFDRLIDTWVRISGGERIAVAEILAATDIRIEPQPIIRGSYIRNGDVWQYCESSDIERIGGKPKWKKLVAPTPDYELVEVCGVWYWRKQS